MEWLNSAFVGDVPVSDPAVLDAADVRLGEQVADHVDVAAVATPEDAIGVSTMSLTSRSQRPAAAVPGELTGQRGPCSSASITKASQTSELINSSGAACFPGPSAVSRYRRSHSGRRSSPVAWGQTGIGGEQPRMAEQTRGVMSMLATVS
jgi:hypothetical protein